MFFSQHFSLPCQYHSTIAPYSSIHLPSTLYNVFLPALQFPLSVSFDHCSILFFICMLLLPQGQTDEAWERSKKPVPPTIWKHSIQSTITFVLISDVQFIMQLTAHIQILSKRRTTILNSASLSSLKHQMQLQDYNSFVTESGVFPLRKTSTVDTSTSFTKPYDRTTKIALYSQCEQNSVKPCTFTSERFVLVYMWRSC